MEHPIRPIIRAGNSVPSSVVERSRGASIQILLGPDDGVPRFATRRFSLAPGGRIPAHVHDDIEHEQIMLEGEMTLGLGDDVHVVKPGDCIFIPAGTPHWYENRESVPVRFLCIVPLTETYSTTWLEPPAS